MDLLQLLQSLSNDTIVNILHDNNITTLTLSRKRISSSGRNLSSIIGTEDEIRLRYAKIDLHSKIKRIDFDKIITIYL